MPPLRAVITYDAKFSIVKPPGRFDVIETVLEFAPGTWTPSHTHGGPAFITVLDGTITVRTKDGEKTYKPGEIWTEHPGEFFRVGNAGAAPASTAVAFLLPKGALLTIIGS